MKWAVIVMVLYSVSMVFYGALEMGHDVLHYLAEHHQSRLHNHGHSHSHSMRDHEHGHSHQHSHSHVSHHHDHQQDEDAAPSTINFFLFAQGESQFRFYNGAWVKMKIKSAVDAFVFDLLPATPPPKS